MLGTSTAHIYIAIPAIKAQVIFVGLFSSGGKALHWYHTGHWYQSPTSLNIIQALFSQLLS